MKKVRIRKFLLPVALMKDKGSFIIYTPLLDLSSVGSTEEEARHNFVDAASLFFEELVDEDRLDEVLTGLGWTKVRRQWEAPQVLNRSTAIAIPVPA
ncbi:MAG: hypothetical protein Q7S64_02110 [bacterium]|nr:hypothetical protein [bacterium]